MNAKTTWHRLLSMLLCLVMAVGLLPTVAFAADDGEIYVGGSSYPITEDFTLQDGKISFDAETKTLTLNGATITEVTNIGGGGSAGIYIHAKDITVKLIGNNTINITDSVDINNVCSGLEFWAAGAIEGPGTLTIRVTASVRRTVSALSKGSSGDANSTLAIRNGATLNLYAKNTRTTVSSTVDDPVCYALYVPQKLSIDGSIVTAKAEHDGTIAESMGVYTTSRIQIANSGRLTAAGITKAIENPSAGTTPFTFTDEATNPYKLQYLNATSLPGNLDAADWKDCTDSTVLTAQIGLRVKVESVSYKVYLGGTEVTSDNKGDILGDGTASYDPATKTLTLNGYNGTYISAKDDLTIDLPDGTNNKITVPANVQNSAVAVTDGGCKLTGNGNLTISAVPGNSTAKSCGIDAKEAVEIATDGNVSITAELYAIRSNRSNVIISGSGDLTAASTSTSVIWSCGGYAERPAFMLNGTGKIILDGYHDGYWGLVHDYNSDADYTYGGTRYYHYKVNEVRGTEDGRRIRTYTHYPVSPYDVWVNGTAEGIVPVTEENKSDILSNGTVSYEPATKTLTLSGYNGGYIEAHNDLVVRVEDEGNVITVPSDVPYNNVDGIDTFGDCTLEGSGNLTINVFNDGAGICTNNPESYENGIYPKVIVNMNGDLTIESESNGIDSQYDIVINGSGAVTLHTARLGLFSGSRGNIILNGSGDLEVVSSNSHGIRAVSGEVMISGSGDVSVKGTTAVSHYYYCDVILSGTGDVTFESTDDTAVYGRGNNEPIVKLNGANPTITITAPEGKQAVANDATSDSLVGGMNIGNYDVTGAPDQNSVTYTKRADVHTVTILANDYGSFPGDKLCVLLVPDGKTINEIRTSEIWTLTDPNYIEHDGKFYVITDYFTNASCQNEYRANFNTPVTGDQTLYADWREIKTPIEEVAATISIPSGYGGMTVAAFKSAVMASLATTPTAAQFDCPVNVFKKDTKARLEDDVILSTANADNYILSVQFKPKDRNVRFVNYGLDVKLNGRYISEHKKDGIPTEKAYTRFDGANNSLVVYAPFADLPTHSLPTFTAPIAKTGLTYNGTEQTLVDPGSAANGTMQYKVGNGDWSNEIPAATDAGTYTVKYRVKGAEGYGDLESNAYQLSVTISQKQVTEAMIGAIDNVTYTGSVFTPEPEIKDGTAALTKDRDFTYGYENNTDAGTATVKITGQGNYTGGASKTFTIAPKAITGATVNLGESLTYNGNEQTQTVTSVTLDGVNITTSCTISNNTGTNAQAYTLTVTANTGGNYTGSITKEFVINPKPVTSPIITLSQDSYVYDGTEKKPDVTTVKDGEITIPDSEYDVSYSNNTNAGDATVTITDNDGGNYTVNGETTFTIAKADSTISITANRTKLYGGGRVILTVVSAPASTNNTVTCDVEDIEITKNEDGTFTAKLPNRTNTYTFTATFAENENYNEATSTCVVEGKRYNPPVGYDVDVEDADNGTVSVNPDRAAARDEVTITVTPDKGYELDTLRVTDKDGRPVKLTEKDGKYTFEMPASKVTVKATFKKIVAVNPFVDVKNGDYFYDAVLWAVEKDITSGTSATTFSPNDPCTRAQIVTFLWRAAGSPEAKNAASFSDVSADAYYAKAVAWAVENGITKGTSDTTFSPDATCTRAQAVTFLSRALKGTAAAGNTFSDVSADSYYAEAVAWAVKQGVTKGTSATTFSPDEVCTRGQIVTFLFRAMAE